jgi:DNA-binding response OmpR family regulator
MSQVLTRGSSAAKVEAVYSPFTDSEQTRNLSYLGCSAMAMSAPASRVDDRSNPLGTASLGAQERAVLAVLLTNRGRVVSRRELSRQAGFGDLSERRCDSVLVTLRRRLGADAVITVRSRGWMLSPTAEAAAASLL